MRARTHGRTRTRATLGIVLSCVLGLPVFFTPSASAAVITPMVIGSPTDPCGGFDVTTLCSPETPEIMAALSEQGGFTVGQAAPAPALTAQESAAFDGIVANYGATASSSSADSIAAVGSAPPSGFSWQAAAGWVQSGFGVLSGGAGITALLKNQGVTVTDPSQLPSGSTSANGGWSGTMSYTNRISLGSPTPTTVANFTETLNLTGIDSSGLHSTVTAFQGANEVGGGAISAPNPTLTFYKGSTPCGSTGTITLPWPGSPTNNTFTVTNADISVTGTSYGVSCSTSTGGGWTDVDKFTMSFNQSGFPSLTFTKTALPARWVQTTLTCSNGQTYTSYGPPVTADVAGTFFQGVAGMCPSTTVANSISETLKTQGGSDLPLSTATTGSTIRSISSSCYAAGAQCYLKLSVLHSGTTTQWDNCFTLSYACDGWWELPQATRSQTYKCEFGTGSTWTLVNIYACSVYAQAFNPADPNLSAPSKPPTTSSGGNCDIGWSSVLDGTIVYKAVSCALSWAFVPSSATLSNWQNQITSWSGHAPISLAVSGYQSLTLFSNALECGSTDSLPSWAPGDQSSCGSVTFTGNPTMQIEGQTVDILTPVDNTFGPSGSYSIIYNAMRTVMLIAFTVWVWRRVSKSFGSRDDDGD